jgi:hypothetical protein
MSSWPAPPPRLPEDYSESDVANVQAYFHSAFPAIETLLPAGTYVIINGPADDYCNTHPGALSLYRLVGYAEYAEFLRALKVLDIWRSGKSLSVGMLDILGVRMYVTREPTGKVDASGANLKWAALFVDTEPRGVPLDSIEALNARGLNLTKALADLAAPASPPPTTPSPQLAAAAAAASHTAAAAHAPGAPLPLSRHEREVAALKAIALVKELEPAPNVLNFSTQALNEALGPGHYVREVWQRIPQTRDSSATLSDDSVRLRRQSSETGLRLGGVSDSTMRGVVVGLVRQEMGATAAVALVREDYGTGPLFDDLVSARVALEVQSWGVYLEVAAILRDAYGRMVLASLARVRAILGYGAADEYDFWKEVTVDEEGEKVTIYGLNVKDADALLNQHIRDLIEADRYIPRRVGPLREDGSRDDSCVVVWCGCPAVRKQRGFAYWELALRYEPRHTLTPPGPPSAMLAVRTAA